MKLLTLSALLLGSISVHAEILFEGYSTVRTGQAQAGYVITRYEFDPKKKQFTYILYLKTGKIGHDVTESLKAISNEKLQPISYQYTTTVGKKIKTIDASFQKGSAKIVISDGKTKSINTPKIEKGVFLGSFLFYLMLQNGYKVGKKFTFRAIAEEEGKVYGGEALIKSEEDYKGQKVFRVLCQFKNDKFFTFVTPRGEILGTYSPLTDLSTDLMKIPSDATKDLPVPQNTLKLLFGNIPTGQKNILALGAPAEATAVKTEASTKPTVLDAATDEGSSLLKPPPLPTPKTDSKKSDP